MRNVPRCGVGHGSFGTWWPIKGRFARGQEPRRISGIAEPSYSRLRTPIASALGPKDLPQYQESVEYLDLTLERLLGVLALPPQDEPIFIDLMKKVSAWTRCNT